MFDRTKPYVSNDSKTIIYPDDAIDLFDVLPISKVGEIAKADFNYRKIPEFNDVSSIVLDIETTGLDPDTCSVYMIGMMNEKGVYKVLKNTNEFALLREFYDVITRKKPYYLYGYNIFGFDLDFLYKRTLKYMSYPVLHPRKYYVENGITKVYNKAKIFGKPVEYIPYTFAGELKNINVIDIFHQILAWDNVYFKLGSSKTLKNAVLDYGLRQERRLELSFDEMMKLHKIWANNEPGAEEAIATIETYCKYDLDDTKLLFDMIVPSIHYQQTIFNLTAEQLSTYGEGYKWNTLCKEHYEPYHAVMADPKLKYKGGFTHSLAGIYNNVAQIDISSAYPTTQIINMAYDSEKDPDMFVLSRLVRLREDRLKFKADKSPESQNRSNSLKICINTAYGFYGTGFLDYNNMGVAAFIAGYVNKLTRFIKSTIEEFGGMVIQVDTDGLIFSAGSKTPSEMHELVQDKLPTDLSIGLDWVADYVYIPPSDTGTGLKKNYLVFKDGKLTKKRGIINNRSRPKYESEFIVNYTRLLCYEGSKAAYDYEKNILDQIASGEYPLSKLTITKTRSVVDKKYKKALNIVDDSIKQITFYIGYNPETKEEIVVDSGPYNKLYYISDIKKMSAKIRKCKRLSGV